MDKFVRIKFNGKISPYLRYVDENYVWSEEQIKSENGKAIEIAKMAFLDHGTPLIPVDDLSMVMEQKAAYLKPAKGIVSLIYEGGNFMTLLPQMEIIEKVDSEFYPIEEGAAIICENDPFDKYRGRIDHVFENICHNHGIKSFHYMFSFRNRTEKEVIEAFKNTPAIICDSTYTSIDWWELMLRCIIKSKTTAKVIARKPISNRDSIERYDKFVGLAEKFGVKILTS